MAQNSLKSKYRLVQYDANPAMGMEASLAAEEVIDQTLDNKGLAEAIHQHEPTLSKGVALMAVNAMAEVLKAQLAESHAVQLADLDGNVLMRLHHDVKLEWKDPVKGKPISFNLTNVKKYIDKDATELTADLVPQSAIVLRAVADISNGFTDSLRKASSMQREGGIAPRKTTSSEQGGGETEQPGTGGGGTVTPPSLD